MIFWLSWYQPTEDFRPRTYPPNEAVLGWWCSGHRGDDAATICALVVAPTERAAKNAVRRDWPEAEEWRFCEPKDNLELSDRFPLDDGWMKERIKRARAKMGKPSEEPLDAD